MPRTRSGRRGLTLLAAAALVVPFAALLPTTSAVAGAPPSALAQPSSVVTSGGLRLENSFVSAVGWVKPGETFPSRLIVTNTGTAPLTGVRVDATAADGAHFTSVSPAGEAVRSATTIAWSVGSLAVGQVRTLVVETQADTLTEDPHVVWKTVASNVTASATAVPVTAVARSHGPKVIPPGTKYESARYGDRPFPVVPVEFADRKYNGYTPANPAPTGGDVPNNADALSKAINDPDNIGSTFNLYQEMSYGQLFPKGTVPALGKTEAFGVKPIKAFTQPAPPQGTCTGVTSGTGTGNRVVNGKYQLPGTTEYYGRDRYGSNIIGSTVPGAGAVSDIDGGCGPTAKSVYDAAVIADPDIDYSDYDTDKDGVVDFFMMVFAGCGGNGASQTATASCPDALSGSYDNIWPHSSSLEGTYSDPKTGLKGYISQDQLKDLEGRPLWYTDTGRSTMTTDDKGDDLKVFVRVGPYNVNPETAIDKASVISHEYGHSLGLPDFYSLGGRDTYGDWTLMATDKSQFMDIYSRQRLGWVVPEVLAPGQTRTEDMQDGKIDTQRISWTTPDGQPYTLSATAGDEGVHNGQAYVATLPGRKLLDESILTAAQGNRLWHSGAGNDFGCSPAKGHNFDIALPGAEKLPAGTKISATMDAAWQIEWDFDYGFVLAGNRDGGKQTLTSLPSEKGYTTDNTRNPNANGCEQTLNNGITGNSASYADGNPVTVESDRAQGTVKPLKFVPDSYDLSSLAGKAGAFLRFSYSTDPGLARAGWFVDNLKIVATPPSGAPVTLYDPAGFEDPKTGGPDSPQVFNGGCKDGLRTADACTTGWNYVGRGEVNKATHAYFLEMRDRSGFDASGHGENDRDAIGFQPGLYLAYADEAHGDGNVGTDNPPAQSPLDSTPEPGSDTPDLNDAAFTAAAGRSSFSDTPTGTPARGRYDNYNDPTRPKDAKDASLTPWEFDYDCLSFTVDSLTGTGTSEKLPFESGADVLAGKVTFRTSKGCGTFDPSRGTVTPSASPSASASASASVAPSASASPSGSPLPASCQAQSSTTLDKSTITAMQSANVTVTGDPATVVDLYAYTRPSTTYRVVRTATIGSGGSATFRVVPNSNTRLYAQRRGCPAGPSVVLNVRTSLSIQAVRQAAGTYTFSGESRPARAKGLLVNLYRVGADGRQVLTAQARAGADGHWRTTRRFTGTGRFPFLVRTGQDLQNAAGASRSIVVTIR